MAGKAKAESKNKSNGQGPPKGNTFWRQRKTHGRKTVFETPEELEAACLNYFDWCHDNPLWETKVSNGSVYELPKMRAMTHRGLCIHLGIDSKTWWNYRSRDEFKEVCQLVDDIMYELKFSGVSAGLLNPTIIARDLNLREKTEVTGEGGGPVEIKDASLNDIARSLAFILASATQGKDG